MNLENIQQHLQRLNGDRVIQNFMAQADARYILFNTGEDPQNFPPYTIDNERLNILALQYLNLGAGLAENQQLAAAAVPLERGAQLLENVHGSRDHKGEKSNYYGLVAALAYYVAFQYSKSFILVGKVAVETNVAALVRFFLIRDFAQLETLAYTLFVSPEHHDRWIVEHPEEGGSQKVYELVIAKALSGYVTYLRTGNGQVLERSRQQLRDLKEIAELERDPAIWWVIRLLLLVSDGFLQASVWPVLSGYFNIEEANVRGYLRGLVYMPPKGIYELFVTQRNSLSKVLDQGQRGSVVSIPTSSGKTRIAEIAILDSYRRNPAGKVLYLAPFRSLAFEIENSMEKVFADTSIIVSHLYGGTGYSSIDEAAIDEASLIIATPEKAKAIIRGNADFVGQLSLVIIDEGHLLGESQRLISNEIFHEELRLYMEENGGRFLLLSAVLPNAEDLCNWLTGAADQVYKENWRPSNERLGILEWDDRAVHLNWESQDDERPSFNYNFIVKEELPWKKRQRKPRYFPDDKNEAVALTAYRLCNFGPVLIFVGIKASVFVMARCYLKAMGEDQADQYWNSKSDFRAFESACIEAYGLENEWLAFARKGILCHNSDLHDDVRLPLERLMRSEKPRVIIATSTLGQGVNLGVSTVIFSTLSRAGEKLNARDFWNIAGRAGRAFIDHEGKILVTEETTGLLERFRQRKLNKTRRFFDKSKIDIARSGIMIFVRGLKGLADETGMSFDLLLQLISENRLEELDGPVSDNLKRSDWIDDTLLSLLLHHSPEGEVDLSWTEVFFSRSLAFIQGQQDDDISGADIVSFMQARLKGLVEVVGTDRNKWRSVVKSGITLSSDLMIEERMNALINVIDPYLEQDAGTEEYLASLEQLELLIRDLPVILEKGDLLSAANVDQIRRLWLTAAPLSQIQQHVGGLDIVTEIYAYVLPWVLNGIAKKMRNRDHEDHAEWLEQLAILVETGLPSLSKVKIYQAGIRSRVAANELGGVFGLLNVQGTVGALRRDLLWNLENYKAEVSAATGEWLELMASRVDRRLKKVKNIPLFTYGDNHEKTQVLLARLINGEQYLVSPDFTFVQKDDGNVDFSSVNNIEGIEFRYSDEQGVWTMHNNNPYVQVDE